MKNKYFVIVAIFLITIGAMALTSCKKDKDTVPANNNPSLSQADLKLSNMIENFKTKGKAHLKSGEVMTIDSAIWYLGATVNYTYGDASQKTIEVSTDSVFITIPLNNNGEIPFSAVWVKYEEMTDSVRAYFQSLSATEKQLVAVQTSAKSITVDKVVLNVTSTFATGAYIPFVYNFNNIDWWSPIGGAWGNGGICSGPNQGMYPTRDAATEIQRRIMMNRSVPAGNFYYDEIESNPLYGGSYPVPGFTGNPNYMGDYIFYNTETWPGYWHCLSPEECNFYLNGTAHVIYTHQTEGGAMPEGKSFISLTGFYGALYVSIPGFILHMGTVNYGVLHTSPNPPAEL